MAISFSVVMSACRNVPEDKLSRQAASSPGVYKSPCAQAPATRPMQKPREPKGLGAFGVSARRKSQHDLPIMRVLNICAVRPRISVVVPGEVKGGWRWGCGRKSGEINDSIGRRGYRVLATGTSRDCSPVPSAFRRLRLALKKRGRPALLRS